MARVDGDTPPAGFVRPFRWDGIAYIWDAHGRMAADFGGRGGIFRPRGWGRMQYMDDPDAVMAEWAAWALERAGSSTDPTEVVARLNNTNKETG